MIRTIGRAAGIAALGGLVVAAAIVTDAAILILWVFPRALA